MNVNQIAPHIHVVKLANEARVVLCTDAVLEVSRAGSRCPWRALVAHTPRCSLFGHLVVLNWGMHEKPLHLCSAFVQMHALWTSYRAGTRVVIKPPFSFTRSDTSHHSKWLSWPSNAARIMLATVISTKHRSKSKMTLCSSLRKLKKHWRLWAGLNPPTPSNLSCWKEWYTLTDANLATHR